MIIYNVTTKVNWTIHDPWFQWMKEDHIPRMLQTGCFFEFKILRLIETDEEEGPTYAIQYHASTFAKYQDYLQEYATLLREHANKHWGDQIISFRTVMEVLH